MCFNGFFLEGKCIDQRQVTLHRILQQQFSRLERDWKIRSQYQVNINSNSGKLEATNHIIHSFICIHNAEKFIHLISKLFISFLSNKIFIRFRRMKWVLYDLLIKSRDMGRVNLKEGGRNTCPTIVASKIQQCSNFFLKGCSYYDVETDTLQLAAFDVL